MKLTEVRDILAAPENFAGKNVTLGGWVKSVRASKAFGFIMLGDGSAFTPIQLVYDDALPNFREISKLSVGSSVVVSGKIVLTPDARQPFEMHVSSLTAEGGCAEDYPLQKKRHSVEFLRTVPHLRPRTNLFQAVLRVRSAAAAAVHRYFTENGFIYVHTPIITGSDCEGAGEMFRVTTMDMAKIPLTPDGKADYSKDFFGKSVNLTVSGQLYGEVCAMACRNIYTFGPTFRAEDSNTPRHAAEFWMIEPEMAFAELDDDMRIAEELIKYVINYVTDNCPDEMNFLNSFVDRNLLLRLRSVADADFAAISYTEAIRLLEKENDRFAYKAEWGCDLQTEHERYLTEEIFRRPVFVTDYPKEIKAFYMKLNDDGRTVAAMDCLVPEVGEIIGGSQREDELDKLTRRMAECGMNGEEYRFYTDLRRYGSVRHSGFGMGFERLVMYLTGITNIRDSIPFPRTAGSCEL